MYVKRGSYTHQLNETRFRFRVMPVYGENKVIVGTTKYANIQGMLTGTDASDLSTKLLAMQTAYARNDGDFYLLQNDNSTPVSAYTILGSQTIGGIRCTRFETPLQDPAELTTYVNYEIDLEADYGGVGIFGGGNAPQNTLISWNQSISIRGTGGPRFSILEARNGLPQKQVISQRTPVFATQRGEAVGLYRQPNKEQPIWPQHLMEPDVEVFEDSADSVGGSGNQLKQRELRTTWNYQFQSIGPLSARPGIGY